MDPLSSGCETRRSRAAVRRLPRRTAPFVPLAVRRWGTTCPNGRRAAGGETGHRGKSIVAGIAAARIALRAARPPFDLRSAYGAEPRPISSHSAYAAARPPTGHGFGRDGAPLREHPGQCEPGQRQRNSAALHGAPVPGSSPPLRNRRPRSAGRGRRPLTRIGGGGGPDSRNSPRSAEPPRAYMPGTAGGTPYWLSLENSAPTASTRRWAGQASGFSSRNEPAIAPLPEVLPERDDRHLARVGDTERGGRWRSRDRPRRSARRGPPTSDFDDRTRLDSEMPERRFTAMQTVGAELRNDRRDRRRSLQGLPRHVRRADGPGGR